MIKKKRRRKRHRSPFPQAAPRWRTLVLRVLSARTQGGARVRTPSRAHARTHEHMRRRSRKPRGSQICTKRGKTELLMAPRTPNHKEVKLMTMLNGFARPPARSLSLQQIKKKRNNSAKASSTTGGIWTRKQSAKKLLGTSVQTLTFQKN